MDEKRWIWEFDDYPNFRFDSHKLEPLLRSVAYEQGRLHALTSLMDQDSHTLSLAIRLENELMASFEIEGEMLNRQSVRSSIRQS